IHSLPRSLHDALPISFFSVGCEVTKQDPLIGEAVRGIIKTKTKYFESALRDAQAEGLVHVKDIPAQAQALFAYVDGVLGQARIRSEEHTSELQSPDHL